MAPTGSNVHWNPSPSLRPSTPSSGDFARSHDNLLSGQSGGAGPSQTSGGSVADAPERSKRVAADNPSEAQDRPIISLLPKVITEDEAKQNSKYADLTYWPTILTFNAVVLLVLLYGGTAAVLGVLVWQSHESQSHNFRLSSENVRMISRYFPSIIGTVTVLLFRQTVREALRMEPYTKMADQGYQQAAGLAPAKGVGGAWFPWQSFTKTPKSFLSVSSLVCQFVVSFVVSFKVALLASADKVDPEDDQHYWLLTVRLYPALLLIGMYVAMIFHTMYIYFHFYGKSTGLKWDPVSIADYASLFAQCNALDYIAPLELRHKLRPEHVMVEHKLFRLGYWHRVRDNPEVEDIVYGIGVEYQRRPGTPRNPVEPRKPLRYPWYQKIASRDLDKTPLAIDECRRFDKCAHGKWPNCEHYPYNENPGCPRWVLIVFWILPTAALGLCIYALVIRLPMRGFSLENKLRLPSHITWNDGHGNHTLPPIDPTDPNSNVLLWALMFRSAPTYLAGIFTSTIVAWIDLNMRFMQPFRNMFGEPEGEKRSKTQRVKDFFGWDRWFGNKKGKQRDTDVPYRAATAAESILLAYITVSPLQVPLTAWDKGHLKVCIFSTLNTLSPLFPIFVGALLIITPNDDYSRVNFSFSLSAWIGLMASLTLYSILLLAAIPGAYRLLPRQLYSLADLIALCHQAKFMTSPYLNITDSTRTPTKAHMEARILLTDSRFLFGVYRGRDDNPHIGFDVTQTRDDDFGPVRLIPRSVTHISPEGLVSRIKKSATFAAEEGRRVATAVAGTIMTAAAANPFSQRLRDLHDHDHDHEHAGEPMELANVQPPSSAETSGSQPRAEFGGRTRNPSARKPVAGAEYRAVPLDEG